MPNRKLFQDLAADVLLAAAVPATKTALLLLDLDGFKSVNDSRGHNFGDALLAQLGPRIRSALRDTDTLARLGGDEFAILLPGVADAEAALAAGRDVLASLAEPFPVDGTCFSLGGQHRSGLGSRWRPSTGRVPTMTLPMSRLIAATIEGRARLTPARPSAG